MICVLGLELFKRLDSKNPQSGWSSKDFLNWYLGYRSVKYYTISQRISKYQDTRGDMSDFGFTHTFKKKRFSYVFQEAVDWCLDKNLYVGNHLGG